MRVFLDTNIVVDFYAQREDHYQAAALIMTLAWRGEIELVISATTFVNAFFLLRKEYSVDEIYDKMTGLVSLCEIASVGDTEVKEALKMRKKEMDNMAVRNMLLEIAIPLVERTKSKEFSQKLIDFSDSKISATKFFDLMKKFAEKLNDQIAIDACGKIEQKRKSK